MESPSKEWAGMLGRGGRGGQEGSYRGARGRGAEGRAAGGQGRGSERGEGRSREEGDQTTSNTDSDEELTAYKNPSNKNPEYDRVWRKTDQGVGSKIPSVFDPPANEYESDRVQNCKSPYEFYRLFMSDEFIEEVVNQSKQYAISQGYPGKGDRVTKDTMLTCQAVMFLSGYNRVPARKMYWQESPDTYSHMVTQSMRRDTFEAVLFCTHFVDNNHIDPEDKFAKVRPLFSNINNTAKLYLPVNQKLCVDEMMVPYFGRHGCKQFIRGKRRGGQIIHTPILIGQEVQLCSS